MIKFTEIIDRGRREGNFTFSVEVLPPPKGSSIEDIYRVIEPIIAEGCSLITVTYHREEVIYKDVGNGLYKKVSVRRRPGTVSISAAIQYKYDIPTMPHLICGGFTKDETESALIDLHYLRIVNVMALRGDPPPGSKKFVPEPEGHAYAYQLVEQIANMNRGIYLYEETVNKTPTDFCIGVAGYPEKHPEAPSLTIDILHLKEKVEKGAHFVITQMFFDNSYFLKFVEKCENIGIRVPIIPGIKPITKKSQINTIPPAFSVNLPDELIDSITRCQTDKEVYEAGIRWAINQCLQLIKEGFLHIHFFSMGNSASIVEVVRGVRNKLPVKEFF